MMINSLLRKGYLIIISIILILVLFSPNPTSASISGSYTNLNNEMIPYSIYDGRFLLVEVFSTECGVCIDQHPELVKFYNDFKDSIVMLSLTVNVKDTIPVLNDFLLDYPSAWTTGIDTGNTFASQYHITATPTMILFDRAGNDLITKVGFTSYEELASNMNYYLSVSNPISAPTPTYDGGNDDSGSVIGDLFGSPIFSIGFFSVIVIMVYLKMTGTTNQGI
ncbi:MAG: Thiol-disulfide oxidoreductase ResA [Candidatus Heimdallarchaeota archaeon LC_2]|nr:MAG: Thiol-disulfide oxidoreductase ResA [Candidatus Heimdallarchaeota archaeon LC_2]